MDHKPALIWTAAAVAIALATSPAFAQFGGGYGGGGFGGHRHGRGNMAGETDQRQVGPAPIKPIKRAEFDARVRADFAAADLDHNGVVTLEEVNAARNAKLAKLIDDRFNLVDSNHDGVISRDEFITWQQKIGGPEAADKLMDEENRQTLDNAHAEQDAHRHFARRDDEDFTDLLVAPVDAMLIVNADANHDMALSLAEDLVYQDARFDAADTDHDGELSEDEIRAARRTMMSYGQQPPDFRPAH